MKKFSLKFKIVPICVAFLVVAACFFSACDPTSDWVRQTIEQYYYRFDGDYSSVENMDGLSVEEMVGRLDIYSAYYTRAEYKQVLSDNSGNKSGIGVSFAYDENEGIVLHSVLGSSPARKAGLKAGDIVLSAQNEGDVVAFNSSDSFTSFISSRADGEEFTLNLKGGDTVTLAKSDYTASYADMYLNDTYYGFGYEDGVRNLISSDDGVSVLPEGTAYIYLSQFFGSAVEEMAELFKIFNERGCTSLILDLRGDGGGYVDVMEGIGGLMVSAACGNGVVSMRAKYKDGSEEVRYCNYYTQNVLPAGTDIYVMADNNTASASEALIGVLISSGVLDYENIFLSDRGDGAPRSYGKGIMQSSFSSLYGTLKLTVAGIYWGNGVTIHGTGLTPSMGCSVAPAPDNIVNPGYDGELDAVIKKINA